MANKKSKDTGKDQGGVWLWKLTSNLLYNKWSGRFFVLKNKSAKYFQRKGGVAHTLRGTLDLTQATNLKTYTPEAVTSAGHKNWCFEFDCPRKSEGNKGGVTARIHFILQAGNERTREAVMEYIKACVDGGGSWAEFKVPTQEELTEKAKRHKAELTYTQQLPPSWYDNGAFEKNLKGSTNHIHTYQTSQQGVHMMTPASPVVARSRHDTYEELYGTPPSPSSRFVIEKQTTVEYFSGAPDQSPGSLRQQHYKRATSQTCDLLTRLEFQPKSCQPVSVAWGEV